ncbi:5965_t:CDS:2 [Funneliformis geosporum]|nr:5965_t:CDS:2 [Funneliformis geosporum]
MGNISPFTPSSAPWAKHDDHDTHKLLHYTNSRNGKSLVQIHPIHLKKEEAIKRRNRIREMQATSFILSNSGVVSAATNSMGKCYADTVAIGNGAKKPDLISINTAWTTVASNSINIAIIALSPQPNNVTINVISSSVENIRP